MHPISETSPLAGLSEAKLRDLHPEVIINIKGHDEIYNQVIYTRHSYVSEDIRHGVKFVPMLSDNSGENRPTLHIDRLLDFTEAPLPLP